jgi:hypothetical protein
MWLVIPAVAIILAQATQPDALSKWCFERGQGAQLCEKTEAECNKLRDLNDEIAQSKCKRVEPTEIQESPIEPPSPPNPERQTPTQR